MESFNEETITFNRSTVTLRIEYSNCIFLCINSFQGSKYHM